MGFRTVVVLSNDRAHEWQNDHNLGKKIMAGTSDVQMSTSGPRADLGYGSVVECAHTDTQTLAIIDSYQYNTIAQSWWSYGQKYEETQVELLRAWADKMGYRLVKKSIKGTK